MNRITRLAPLIAFASLIWAAGDTCIQCHQDPELLVTNKKLYDYFQNWRASAHGHEDVACVDCHGGDNTTNDKIKAHGKDMSTDKVQSAVHYKNIPTTCGECHDSFLNAYKDSKHFAQLVDKGESDQGPNCVTCHGSLNSVKPVVNTVHDVCLQCHNIETKNNPDIPNKSVSLLNDLNAIRGYRRYISKRSDPLLSKPILHHIDTKIVSLAEHWHQFDLAIISKDTKKLLHFCRQEREKIRAKRKQKAKEK